MRSQKKDRIFEGFKEERISPVKKLRDALDALDEINDLIVVLDSNLRDMRTSVRVATRSTQAELKRQQRPRLVLIKKSRARRRKS